MQYFFDCATRKVLTSQRFCLFFCFAALSSFSQIAFALEFIESETDISNVRYIEVSPDGRHVYATDTFKSSIVVFSRNQTDGQLTFVENIHDGDLDNVGNLVRGIERPWPIIISPDNRHVYVANFAFDTPSAAVTLFKRDIDTGRLTFVASLNNGGVDNIGNTVDGIFGSRSIAVSPEGQNIYATGSNNGLGSGVVTFSRNADTGQITFVENIIFGELGGNLFSIMVSRDGRHVYVAGSDSGLVVFSRNLTTGQLIFVENIPDNEVSGLDFSTSVAISPDNQYVYATGGGSKGSLVTFRRNINTGHLTFQESLRNRRNK